MMVSGNEYVRQQEMKASDLRSRIRLAREFTDSDFK